MSSTTETSTAEISIAELTRKVADAELVLFGIIEEEMLQTDMEVPRDLLQKIRDAPMEEDDPSWFTYYVKDYLEYASEEDLEIWGYNNGVAVEEMSFHVFLSKHLARFDGELKYDEVYDEVWSFDMIVAYANNLVEKVLEGAYEFMVINYGFMIDYIYARHALWLATREDEELAKAARD